MLEPGGCVSFIGESVHDDRQENDRRAPKQQHRIALRFDDVCPDHADH